MTAFAYRNGMLCADGVPLSDVADAVGTPFYCYSADTLTRAYHGFTEALASLPFDSTICYALKANGNLAVIRTLAALGAGADVVSAGELRRALAAGVAPGRIVFSGVGKTREELAFALAQGIMQLNVESEDELTTLDAVAREMGVRAPIAIRVNPDVDAATHHKISTGRKHDKFGIDFEAAEATYRRAIGMPGIAVTGIAVHIGSQITDLAPYRAAFGRVAELVRRLRAADVPIRRIDAGGGLGIAYRDEAAPDIGEYAAILAEAFGSLGCAVVIEPGRRLVGPAGVLVTRVIRLKEAGARRFVIVDAAMNDLMRPALYDAWHPIRPVQAAASGAAEQPVDVVGPVCESTDIFAAGRALPPIAAGDLLAFGAAGAYGAVMASEYNGRPLVPEVLAADGRWTVVRRRPNHDEMLALERMPDWLSGPARRDDTGGAG